MISFEYLTIIVD